jgi:hypothetical protein
MGSLRFGTLMVVDDMHKGGLFTFPYVLIGQLPTPESRQYKKFCSGSHFTGWVKLPFPHLKGLSPWANIFKRFYLLTSL